MIWIIGLIKEQKSQFFVVPSVYGTIQIGNHYHQIGLLRGYSLPQLSTDNDLNHLSL